MPTDSTHFHAFHPQTLGGHFRPGLESAWLERIADELVAFRGKARAPGNRETNGQPITWPIINAVARQANVPLSSPLSESPGGRIFALRDAQAPDVHWNPVARELFPRLREHGLAVWEGVFCLKNGRLNVRDHQGWEYSLAELDAERGHSLFFWLSDGHALRQPRARFALEHLRHWPRCVWLELRDNRAWDELTALPARLGLSVHAATPEEVWLACREVLGKSRDTPHPDAKQAESWRGFALTRGMGTSLSVTVERMLGDALPWAQACAMLPPPLSQALAETLRARFYSRLPTTRLSRLLTLPTLRLEQDALVFSPELLAILRGGFSRQSQTQQEQVLNFLLRTVGEAEPREKNSLAHREWHWYFTRLKLESEPDAALAEIAKLLDDPDMAARIYQDLDGVALPLSGGAQTYQRIPLWRRPRKRRSLRLLLRLSPDCGVGPSEIQPWRFRWHYWRDSLYNQLFRARHVAAFSPDGRWIIEACAERQARVWEAVSGEEKHFLPGRVQDIFGASERPLVAWFNALRDVSSLVAGFSPDGRRMVTVLKDNTVRIWDTDDARILSVLKGYRIWLRAILFTPDSEQVLAITEKGEIWDIARGRLLRRLFGHERFINAAALSPDGKLLATVGCDARARLWRVRDGGALRVMEGHVGRVMGVAFSPDGELLATCGQDKTVRLWRQAEGEEIQVLRGHRGAVNAVNFSPDGHWLVSASSDRDARLWQVESGECLQILSGHQAKLNSVMFAPDGCCVLTAGDDCTRIWELDAPETEAIPGEVD